MPMLSKPMESVMTSKTVNINEAPSFDTESFGAIISRYEAIAKGIAKKHDESVTHCVKSLVLEVVALNSEIREAAYTLFVADGVGEVIKATGKSSGSVVAYKSMAKALIIALSCGMAWPLKGKTQASTKEAYAAAVEYCKTLSLVSDSGQGKGGAKRVARTPAGDSASDSAPANTSTSKTIIISSIAVQAGLVKLWEAIPDNTLSESLEIKLAAFIVNYPTKVFRAVESQLKI